MEDKRIRPTVSRVLDNGTLIELLHDPDNETTAFAVAYADGRFATETKFDLPNGDCLVPYSAANNLIATKCVLLPSEVAQFPGKTELVGQVRDFIHQYVDLSPTFEAIAAHYVLLTWVYDAFNEIGYLRLKGDFGTGKTRALLAIGSLCYKPFFASGASTVSPIFHVAEAFGGTLILDEADFRTSDATADLTKILNNGSVAGLPVLRTMTNRNRELNPQAFRVYGPKIVGMRGGFADPALESRFITEDTGKRPLRGDIPIQVPDVLYEEARDLRNKLLAWRFVVRRTIGLLPILLPNELSPRARQTVASLLSLVDDAAVRDAVCEHVGGLDRQLQMERPTDIAPLVLDAIVDAFERGGTAGAAIGVIASLFNSDPERPLHRSVSPKWIGNYVRTGLGLRTQKTHGVFAIPATERARVEAMRARFDRAATTGSSDELSSP